MEWEGPRIVCLGSLVQGLQLTLLQMCNYSYVPKQCPINDSDLRPTVYNSSCWDAFNQDISVLLSTSLVTDPHLSFLVVTAGMSTGTRPGTGAADIRAGKGTDSKVEKQSLQWQ